MWKKLTPLLPLLPGFIIPNVMAPLVIWGTRAVLEWNSSAVGVLILAEFILVPLMMGFVSGVLWRRQPARAGRLFLWSLINTGIALGLSALMMGEGVICLLIVSPLLLGGIFGGTLIGWHVFRHSNRLGMSVAPTLLLLILLDALSPHSHQAVVSDTLLIRARPEEVWRYVVEVPPIPRNSGFWLFRLGLPRPVRTTATGHRAGEERRCVFEGDLVFRERIVELEPGKKLTFDVVRQPEHPEIMGHLDVTRGQLLLRDNGDGTTTLTGHTWYRLHVYPAWYYELWADSIGRNVHFSVMGHIKTLAERDAQAAASGPGASQHASRRSTSRPVVQPQTR